MPDGFHYKNDRLKKTRDAQLELGGAKDHFAPPSLPMGRVQDLNWQQINNMERNHLSNTIFLMLYKLNA